VSTCREVDVKREFTADGNEAAGNVSTRNRTGVPSVNKKKDGFESDPDGIAFIRHDAKPFIQVSIDALNEHGVMVVARQNMVVDVEEIKGFLEYRIRSVGIDPILMRGEPDADGAIEKCLRKSCRGGVLTWVKELAVLRPNMNAALVDITKDASRCEARDCSVKTECVRWMR
jgi:hypothetical protein